MRNYYYQNTAYSNINPPVLRSSLISKPSYLKHQLLRRPLFFARGPHCAEFIGRSREVYILEKIKENSDQLREELMKPHHERYLWMGLRNAKTALFVATQVMLFFAIGSWLTIAVILILSIIKRPDYLANLEFISSILFTPSVPTILYFFGLCLLKSGRVKDKNNIVFNRRTGMVTIPWRKGAKELAFADFGAYLNSVVSISGREDYNLLLYHRGNHEIIQDPGAEDKPWQVCVTWEFLQQFMDISMPLPDVPSMEPFRHKDPVTAEYDREHRRPPRYWRDMDIEHAKRMHDASYQAAAAFPWGLTRDQALMTGWMPSGCGEGDWRGEDKSERICRNADAG